MRVEDVIGRFTVQVNWTDDLGFYHGYDYF